MPEATVPKGTIALAIPCCLQPDRTGDNVTVRPETLYHELPKTTAAVSVGSSAQLEAALALRSAACCVILLECR